MQLIFDFPVTPSYTFTSFVVCSGNRTAYQFAQRLLDPHGTENLLYLHGPRGAGKTHLLTALGHALARSAAAESLPCLSCKELAARDTIPLTERLTDLFSEAPALLIDDLHCLPDDQNLRLEIWQLFNEFYGSGRKIVVTALVPPRELVDLDDHLISRLLWGLVAKVDIGDDDSRRMIMKKLAEDRQIILPADVIDYLLLHVRREIPALAAALEVLKRHAFTTQRKISVRLAREAFATIAP